MLSDRGLSHRGGCAGFGRALCGLSVLAAAVAGACGDAASGPVVADFVDSECTTAVVLELSEQVADEVACMAPGALVPFSDGDGIAFVGGAVLPYVSSLARDDLLAAVAELGPELRITSGFRTVVQQYLLYEWSLQGRCGIAVAAEPGRSNHESGRALDIANHAEVAETLARFGWVQTVLPSDPVHFDHLESPDIRGLDVLAFQRLWNRNNLGDAIDEDGVYGPETESRIAQSPADGFDTGGCEGAAARRQRRAGGGGDREIEAPGG